MRPHDPLSPHRLKELLLVRDADWRAWPPRLPDQPIFYPVTTCAYAEKIARDWNSVTPAPDNLGFVTRFEITDDLAAKYPVQDVGGHDHQELWIPAEDLDALNAGILGTIDPVAAYRDKAPMDLAEAARLWGA
ncbi:MAG: ADP-ribosylation/crystallin J1 [Rhodobacteraceae bacterium]|nr:ADP-ribosylation/crystallin J1 [Paracoccaceae bacterium]